MTRFIAKWPGVCNACGHQFPAGAEITWQTTGPVGRVRHATCPQPTPQPTPSPTPDPPAPDPSPPPAPPSDIEVPETPDTSASALDALADAVWTRIEPRVQAAIQPPSPEETKPIRRRILIVTRDGAPKIEVENPHPAFASLLMLAADGENIYLYGGAGTGKSHAGLALAQTLGREYRECSLCPQSVPSDMFGFIDAMGRIVNKAFRLAWEHGYVFLLDELDNSRADVIAALNACLASGWAEFPDARVPRHPQTVILAAGNTPGFGPTLQYPHRRQFDAATRTRFFFLDWHYDKSHELQVARAWGTAAGITPEACDRWTTYVHTLRDYCETRHPAIIPSPRAAYYGCRQLGRFSVAKLADMLIFQGLEPATVKQILADNPLPSIDLIEPSRA